jgi:hypothetical protein
MLSIASIICFALAAVLGVALTAMYQKGKLSLNTALAHGACGAAGLVLLIATAVGGGLSTVGMAALGLFVIAALGGFVLFFNHLTKHSLPKPLIAIHGAAAVVAFLLLLFGSLK